MNKKLNILISNDDGYNSLGLSELSKELQEIANITIVAPKNQQSGVSSSLTFTRPIVTHSLTMNDNIVCHIIDGTPADCVKLALNNLLDEVPDLVISGINLGRNTAINILYSGTVGAAIEGYIKGIPSIAVSINNHHHSDNLAFASKITRTFIEKYIINKSFKTPPLFNINIPDLPEKEIKGFRFTKIANTRWEEFYEKRTAPYGWEYFWFAGKFEYKEDDTDTDDGALKNGYISVSPLKLDFLDNDLFNQLNDE